jgi:hypothetical protein
MTYEYNESTGRYIVRNAQIQFANFGGLQTQFNNAGKRNFKLIVDEELGNELREQGVYVSELKQRDELDPIRYSVKIGVYPTSDINLVSGHTVQPLTLDTCGVIDMEMRKGHVRNGEVKLEFHVSENRQLAKPAIYLRLDTLYVPINKSKLTEEYEDYDVLDEAEA